MKAIRILIVGTCDRRTIQPNQTHPQEAPIEALGFHTEQSSLETRLVRISALKDFASEHLSLVHGRYPFARKASEQG